MQRHVVNGHTYWRIHSFQHGDVAALSAIENELMATVVRGLDVKLDPLFYDTTNLFPYIASTNTGAKLPQRGQSTQKRTDPRWFCLALVVSREGQIPLCSQVWEGNKVAGKLFPDSLSRIRQRRSDLSMGLDKITVVSDNGNMSKANQAWGDEAPFGYVASLTPAHRRVGAEPDRPVVCRPLRPGSATRGIGPGTQRLRPPALLRR